ncbi:MULTISPECIES: hypothetical protein [unclassified Novosphingobium]|uniref:hypothetical protein n=1 Tax=unclassified Novosphingobium TaxID=2644732 RepID=UPI00146EAF11|nr:MULTISPECIES: hypothetical protein [unclassified Novosphingobium]NMN07533.1 hypothetical protein [Novosphingobium sp. SG919]NMN89864.1 hypothetical protein [Novosphingobium sp. SG916]
MSDQPTRRSLLASVQTKTPTPLSGPAPSPVDDHALREAAERHGFTAAGSTPPTLRRKRSGAGRSYQLNVRLRPDTASLIYDESNRRDIPIAQVIEEAMEALCQQRGS